MEMIKDAIARAVLPAADIDRAKAFWAKLGLSPVDENPGGVDYDLGGGTGFTVYQTPNPNRGGHTQMGLRVNDIDSEVADMRAKGVVFEEYDTPNLKTVNGIATLEGLGRGSWFKDPDGNFIGVIQRT
jgi:catechol 2,3-dioxygenase-like lactoylglutathione lyase family enzyme